MKIKGFKVELPEKAKCSQLLEDWGQVKSYEDNFYKRGVEVFTRNARYFRWSVPIYRN